MRLIFVALCDYENFLTTKIFRFTVGSALAERAGQEEVGGFMHMVLHCMWLLLCS